MLTEKTGGTKSLLVGGLVTFLRICLFKVISTGPIPDHIAFIMDGNRRYAKKHNFAEGSGHKAGYSSLVSMLGHCYELGVKYVTVYAFSIDNFKRRPNLVKFLMDLMLEKIEQLLDKEGLVNQYGLRIYFFGNLKLLSEPVRAAVEKVMKATEKNKRAVLLVCVPYASTDEIVNAVKESCENKRREIQTHVATKLANGASEGVEVMEELRKLANINLVDVEKHMYMGIAPDPDILIRSSGETRLSNFLLWQTANCPLYSPAALWPELDIRHLVWAVLNFQRSYQYLEKKKQKKISE